MGPLSVASTPRTPQGGGDPAALRATAVMLLSKYGARYGSDDTCITTVVERLHGKQTRTRVPTFNEQCKMVSAVLEHLAWASLKFTPLPTHEGGWLSKAEETVVLLKMFSEVNDLGSLLIARKIYDHILSRFPEKEYDHLGKSTENNREPFMLWGNVKMCYPDHVGALQAEMQSNPNKFKQSPTCRFADHLEANAKRYRAHLPW